MFVGGKRTSKINKNFGKQMAQSWNLQLLFHNDTILPSPVKNPECGKPLLLGLFFPTLRHEKDQPFRLAHVARIIIRTLFFSSAATSFLHSDRTVTGKRIIPSLSLFIWLSFFSNLVYSFTRNLKLTANSDPNTRGHDPTRSGSPTLPSSCLKDPSS